MKNSNDTSWDRTSDLPILLLYFFLNSDGQCGVRTGHPGLDYEQGPTFSLLQHVQPGKEVVHPGY